jgi:uncharacterized membrane protein HdeD (DUF308 family)
MHCTPTRATLFMDVTKTPESVEVRLMLLLRDLARKWWIIVLQGVAAILFGILAFARPGATLAALLLLVAIWAIADGILALLASVGAAETKEPWWPWVLHALVSIGVGLVALRWPGITALALLLLIAYWAILRGILTILAAIQLRRVIQGEFWMVLNGIISVVFGAWIVASPAEGALAVVWLIGLYAVAFGVTLVLAGVGLKKLDVKG